MSLPTLPTLEEAGDMALEELRASADLTPETAVERLKKVLSLPDERDYVALLTWAGQAHIVDLLESVFYLAFHGKTGSGKGTGVETCVHLSPDGILVGTGSEAYLAARLDEGKTVGIEEADILMKKNETIEGLLRNGYRRGAKYGKMVPKGKAGWEAQEYDIFGPKVFDYHASMSAHILGRSVAIGMRADNSVDRALDAERKAAHVAPVRRWLEGEASEARKAGWTKERVDALWEDSLFRERVAGMGGKWGRDHVISAIMLTVCEVFGWDLGGMLRDVMVNRKTLDEYGLGAEALEILKEDFVDNPEWIYPFDRLHHAVNDRRKQLNLRGVSAVALSTALQDLGFEKDGDYYYKETQRGEYRQKMILKPWEVVKECLE